VLSICEASERSAPEVIDCLHLRPFWAVPTQVKRGPSGYMSRTARGSQGNAMAIGDVLLRRCIALELYKKVKLTWGGLSLHILQCAISYTCEWI
jgi:hypothetical protein